MNYKNSIDFYSNEMKQMKKWRKKHRNYSDIVNK